MDIQVGDIIKLENNQFVTVSKLVETVSTACGIFFTVFIGPHFYFLFQFYMCGSDVWLSSITSLYV